MNYIEIESLIVNLLAIIKNYDMYSLRERLVMTVAKSILRGIETTIGILYHWENNFITLYIIMLFKSQVIAMLYSSYEGIDDYKDFPNFDEGLVKECPKGSGYDYGIYIGEVLKRYGEPKYIDTGSCYPTNWIKCKADIVGKYFNVVYDTDEVLNYVIGSQELEKRLNNIWVDVENKWKHNIYHNN